MTHTTRKLKNYLRTFRRRTGLTQEEMAYLLGSDCGSKVSRYERRLRQPGVETVFAYEVISGQPAKELFVGDYQVVKTECLRRMRGLLEELASGHQTRRAVYKQKLLRSWLAREGYLGL